MKNNIKELLSKRIMPNGKPTSVYRFAKDLNLSYNTATNWANSETLSADKIQIVADYFGVQFSDVFK